MPTITNDEPNVVLTPEQTKAIEETKVRLFNIENEITIHTKNLNVIKSESLKATKEKIYQEELLASSIELSATSIKSLNATNEALGTAKAELAKLQSEVLAINTGINKKELELKDREDKVVKREQELELKSKKLDESNQLLKSHIETFDEKVAKLKSVISTF